MRFLIIEYFVLKTTLIWNSWTIGAYNAKHVSMPWPMADIVSEKRNPYLCIVYLFCLWLQQQVCFAFVQLRFKEPIANWTRWLNFPFLFQIFFWLITFHGYTHFAIRRASIHFLFKNAASNAVESYWHKIKTTLIELLFN